MSRSNQPLDSQLVIDPFVISSFTGPDNHTGLFLDADQVNSSVLFRTNDTNAIYVDKFQNVGINTLAPSAQLDINATDGDCLKLTYNGSSNKAGLQVASDGKLSLTSSGGEVSIQTPSDFNVRSHNGTSTGLKLNDILVRSSADQLNYNVVTPGTASASKALVVDTSRDIVNIRNLTAVQLTGTIQTSAQPNITSVSTFNITAHDGSQGLSLGNILVTATAAQLNYNAVTPGTAIASKALVVDVNKDIVSIRNLTASQLTGTLQTAAQPTITSVGTLLGLNIDGSLTGLSNLAIATTSVGRALIVNSDVGNCFQLCYDTPSGIATTFVDMLVSSAGDLTITPSGGNVNISSHNGSTTGLKLGGTLVLSSADQINYLSGTTPGTATGGKALIFDSSRNIENINNLMATQLSGTIQTAAQPNINSVNVLNIANHNGSTLGLRLNNTLVTATATEINYIDTTPGAAEASKALVLDSSSNISGIASLSATTLVGTIQTSAQPNISSVSALDVTTHNGTTVGLRLGGVLLTATATQINSIVSGSGSSSFTSLTSADSITITNANGIDKGLILGSTLVLASADQLNYNVVTPGTASASKALVLNATSDITGINSLTATSLSGTLQTAVQPNITSVGTLTNIATSGTFTMGSTVITATEIGVIDGVVPGTASASKALVLNATNDITGINSLTATSLTGTLQTASQPNITTVGTLTNISTSGTFTMGSTVISAAEIGVIDGVVPGTASVSKALVLNGLGDIVDINSLTATSLIATSLVGTLQTADQPNIISVGTLTNIATSGTFTMGSTVISATEIGFLDGVVPGTASVSKALVLNGSGDIVDINSLSATSLIATSLTGTLQTAAQPNITSVGTLTNIATSGTFTMGSTVISAAEIGVIDGVVPGTASVSKALVLNATSDITGINSLSATSLTGTLQTAAQPNITSVGTLTNIATSGTFTMGSTVISAAEIGVIDGVVPGTASVSKALVLNATSDITGINSLSATSLTGTLQTAAQPNITSVGTLTSLTTLGDIDCGGNLMIGGTIISESEIIYLDSATPGTAEALKAMITDASNNIGGVNSLSATSLTGTIQTAAQPNITSVAALNITSHNGTTVGLRLGGVLLTATAAQINSIVSGSGSSSFTTLTAADTITITNANGIDKGLVLGSTLVLASADQLNYNVVIPGTATASKSLVLNATSDISGINSLSATSLTGTLQTAAQPNITSVGTLTSVTTSGTLTLGATSISESEIGVLDGVVPGTASASKAIVLNATSDISGINSLSATSLTGTLQTAAQPTITSVGTLTSVTTSGTFTMGSTVISAAEIGVLDGVTPGTALASKALVLNSSKAITGITSLASTSIGVGTPANSVLPVEIGFTTYQFTGAYAYNNDVNAHGIVDAGSGPSANYSLRADGRILVTGEVEITSDRRLKKNITALTPEQCKSFILTTTPVRFNWKSDDAIPDYGYIAQDVLKAGFDDLVTVVPHPEMEGSVDDDGFINPTGAKYVFSPGKIIPMVALNQRKLFEANDAKDVEIIDLKARLNALEALVAQFLQK